LVEVGLRCIAGLRERSQKHAAFGGGHGGTFTDVRVFDESGTTRVGKVSSMEDTIDAIFDGIRAAGVEMGKIGLFSYGTTVAAYALITRSFPEAATITTKSFRE
jgi:N-methylhydantoinase A